MNLTQHKVLVTGGSDGIGLALAREFLARGNQVTICGRNLARLQAAQLALGAVGDVHIIQADLADPDAAVTLMGIASDKMQGLSILVNNAGIQKNFSFATAAPALAIAASTEEIQVNLLSLIALTAAAVPWLQQASHGAIINVSSALAITPKADAAVYCASKAAVHSFSQALRYQFEADLPHIRVFEVMPPLVETLMTAGHGTGKITPAQVASETFSGLARDKQEIRVGKARLLGLLHRLAPGLAAKIIRAS